MGATERAFGDDILRLRIRERELVSHGWRQRGIGILRFESLSPNDMNPARRERERRCPAR